jgi:Ser/Thr protein kinase RdoA (MazF antagonist)
MGRREWEALPAGVRSAVEERCGPVIKAEIPEWGYGSEFSSTLHLDRGAIFCKGIRADASAAWMHRNEVSVNPWLPDLVPRLLWQFEADGWLLLGFEYVDGRPADLSPWSDDLVPIAAAVAELGRELTPCPTGTRSLTARWARRPVWRMYLDTPPGDLDPWDRAHLPEFARLEEAAPALVDGDTLLHTDLHPGNLLMDGGGVRVADWAWRSRGAAWVDPAFLVIRLMAEGHSAYAAEAWAQQVPAWREAEPGAVTVFAATVLGLWEDKTRMAPRPDSERLTAAARMWARHRLATA